MEPTWTSDCGTVKLWLADCREVLPTLPSGSVDAVVTDPPYGVNLGNHAASNEKRPQYLAKCGYENYDDTPENYEMEIVPRLRAWITAANRSLVFSAGTQMWKLPEPAAVGGVFLPAGCGRSRWGFQCHSHFVMYGKAPDLQNGANPTGWSSTEASGDNGHPCPKPIGWMLRAVRLASRDRETVADPFMGSGTTGVAAVRLGRKFLGIEKEPKYFAIAQRRIQEALNSQPLFKEQLREQQNELWT